MTADTEALRAPDRASWRVFQCALARDYWGIEIDGDNDADPVLYPSRVDRKVLDNIVNAHNAELIRLRAEVETVRTEAKRMDLARNQFLGERNMLQEALRDIQRGDMTNMMEFTEAEAAKIRAGWALKKIGQPVKPAAPEVQP